MVTPSRIIVVGASAGGIEALIKMVESFPKDLSAAVFIVLHLAPNSHSILPTILSRHSSLPAKYPSHEEEIQAGNIYVAPPNHHLLIKEGIVKLSKGPRENGFRPAIDPLFRSAAQSYEERVIGVVLSGCRNDGAAGLIAIKQRGGVAIAQMPTDALHDSMPQSAINTGTVDYIVAASDMGSLFVKLSKQPLENEDDPPSDAIKMENEAIDVNLDSLRNLDRFGKRSTYSCPDCGGTLWEFDNHLIRFRCHVGHAYTAETLLEKQNDGLEEALWTALRVLEEQYSLSSRLAQRARDRNQNNLASRFEERARESEEHGATIRRILLNGSVGTDYLAARGKDEEDVNPNEENIKPSS